MEVSLEGLTIDTGEDKELILTPDDVSAPREKYELCLVGRFLTDRHLNFNVMKNRMASVWRPGKGVCIRDLGDGLYLFQFYHAVDLKRVLEGGPWSLDNHLLVVHQLQPGDVPTMVPLVHKLPIGYMFAYSGKQLGDFVGKIVEYDSNNNSGLWHSFMRIRVSVDVRLPLKLFKNIRHQGGDRTKAPVRRGGGYGGERWLRNSEVKDGGDRNGANIDRGGYSSVMGLISVDGYRADVRNACVHGKLVDVAILAGGSGKKEISLNVVGPSVVDHVENLGLDLVEDRKRCRGLYGSKDVGQLPAQAAGKGSVRLSGKGINVDAVIDEHGEMLQNEGVLVSNIVLSAEVADDRKGNWRLTEYYENLDRTNDKKGRIAHPKWLFWGFRDVVTECGLIDLPLNGYQFTWARSKGWMNAVEERIDRALVTNEWADIFPNSKLSNLVAPFSDYSPILLETELVVRRRNEWRLWLCLDELVVWNKQEETFWRQRAKVFWYRDGDLNTRFFHSMASARKQVNKIHSLRGDDGVLYDDDVGVYSVKSGYKLAVGLRQVDVHKVGGEWRKMWSLSVPSKVKHFLWRAGRGCLPTSFSLQGRGVTVPSVCVVCGREVENEWHLFVSCSFAGECRKEAKLYSIVDACATTAETYSGWMFDMLIRLSDIEVGNFPWCYGHYGEQETMYCGKTRGARSLWIEGLLPVKEREAIGMVEALSWIRDLGYEQVVFETDALCVVQALHSQGRDLSEFGCLIHCCKRLVAGHEGFSFQFVRRLANRIAHSLT
ncbi:hypothetical protein PTKIN_Ptkin13bG0250500 [Pterospermum kingtungense]